MTGKHRRPRKRVSRDLLRDVALVAAAAALTAFVGLDVGVTSLTVDDLRVLLDASVAATVTMALMALTPMTARYGVGRRQDQDLEVEVV